MIRGATLLLLLLAAGCAGPKPFVFEGDANRAAVRYGGDLAAASALARAHCARWQRAPKLIGYDLDLAYFACVPP